MGRGDQGEMNGETYGGIHKWGDEWGGRSPT